MTDTVSVIRSIVRDRLHSRMIPLVGLAGMSILIGATQPGLAGGANDAAGSDASLRQRIDKINDAMNAFVRQYAEKPATPPVDAGGYFTANERGYHYAIPAYWLWHYAIPAADANLPENRKPLTWLLKGSYGVAYKTTRTFLLIPKNFTVQVPDWGSATAVDPATDGCTQDPMQRRIQIDFPKRGDYVCVPVPTKPAIWVRNPNENDVFMSMVAVEGCPKGLLPTLSNWPTPGDKTCAPPPQPRPSPEPAPSGDGLTASSDLTSPQPCVSFKIILESGTKIDVVVMTTSDFEILKQNDHVFTVLPAKPEVITAVPTMGIHQLNLLIKQHSYTSVPDVPANDI